MPRESHFTNLHYLLVIILALVGISKLITTVLFKTYLGMWDPVDELLLKMSVPLYVLQISMQLILLYWIFEGWRKNVIRKELGDRFQVNGILIFLGFYFEEKGTILVLFAISIALYVMLLILVSILWQKIEQKFPDLISHCVVLFWTLLGIFGCLVCI